MTPEEFRRWGHAVVDWLAAYRGRVEELPVLSRARPGEVRAALPASAPEHGEPFDALLADVDRVILPGITHWQSPNFFAYFPANTSGPSILGELLSAGLGVQGMLWATSPACTELETHVLDWLVDMLALPAVFKSDGPGGGVIQDTASSAALCALLAARERATAGRSNRGGCDGQLVAYASTQTHSSVEKGIRIAGVGADNLRLIAVDRDFAMRPDELAAAHRRGPSGGIDAVLRVRHGGHHLVQGDRSAARDRRDLPRPRPLAARRRRDGGHRRALPGVPLHPRRRRARRQLLLQPAQVDVHQLRLRLSSGWPIAARLIDALSILPEYLRNHATESGAVIDYRDWQMPLGRRFRALKLWFVIRHYGVEGLRRQVRAHVAASRELRSWIGADARFELAAPTPLNLVCFRHRGGDAANQTLLDRLNAGGGLYLTSTRLDGKLTLRMSIGQTYTERRHVEAAWEKIRAGAGQLATAP